jgi:hypothetical protein
MSSNQERINQGAEKERPLSKALEQAGEQRRHELEQQREKEKTPETSIEDARHEVEAITAEKEKKIEQERPVSPAERRATTPSKTDRAANFNTTMSEVRTQMSAPSRAFSKVIHNKTVETVSEAVGNTIARPNAILSGAIFAFALTLGVYLVAKNLGYPLSGFESIGAFIVGWIVGIVYDFLKAMITGRT